MGMIRYADDLDSPSLTNFILYSNKIAVPNAIENSHVLNDFVAGETSGSEQSAREVVGLTPPLLLSVNFYVRLLSSLYRGVML